MATGFVSGKEQILTNTESTSLNRSPKNLSQVIMSVTPIPVPNLVQIHLHVVLCKWMKHKAKYFIYLYVLVLEKL